MSRDETSSSGPNHIIEAQAEAERILNSQNPLAEIKTHLDNLIAGEDYNKQLAFVLLLSGKVPDPNKKQMILLAGSPGGGKTTLMGIADLFKTKTIGRLSDRALDYTDDLGSYEVLRLQELGHMDWDQPIKFVSADDKGYTIEVTVPSRQQEAGNASAPFRTFTKQIPPITLITSTTRLETEAQFRRRNWIISPDESEEQTEKVRKWKLARIGEEDRLNQNMIRETNYDRSKRVLTTVVRMIKPCKVTIPFTDSLTRLLPQENVEVRGHYDKLLNLVNLYGVLLQKQLPSLNGSPVITADRALEVLDIAKSALEAMSSVETRIALFVRTLEEEGLDKGSIIDREERASIAAKMKKAPRTLLTYLNFLEDEGYATSVARGRERIFELVAPPKQMMAKFSSLASKLSNKETLLFFMNSEARDYLARLCDEKRIDEEHKTELINHFPI